jgi:hypothetical protein
MIVLLIGGFIIYNGNEYKQLTGKWQYSPFSGWQLANNAMYAYRYVDSANRLPVEKQYAKLDNMIRKYFDTTRNPFAHPEGLLKASTVYMWDPHSPLYRYRDGLFVHETTASELKKWASMGPFYSKYGLYIIRKYPAFYIQDFIWPNICKYYAPPVEFLDHYNSNEDSIKQPALLWFNIKNPKALIRVKTLEVKMLDYYPIMAGIANVVFLLNTICLVILGFFRQRTPNRDSIILIALFWLANAFFTILASSVALRFQAFPVILVTMSSFLLIDLMVKMARMQDEMKQNLIKPQENASQKVVANFS